MESKRIFLSCVTSEFGELRQHRRDGLVRAGYQVEVQPDFPQSAADTVQKLSDMVKSCDVVVHVVGAEAGSVATSHAVRDFLADCADGRAFLASQPLLRTSLGDCSDLTYTQWEAFLALHHGLALFVYTSLEPDGAHPQRQHLDRLQTVGRFAERFTSEAQLADMIQADLRRHFGGGVARRISNLPGSIGSLFKGRKGFLADLRARLTEACGGHAAAATATQAVHGLGGIGKTRLAIEYGHRYAGGYGALLFITADSPQSLRRNLAELTGPMVLDLPEYGAPEEEARLAATLRWLDAHPGWFLILDNVDTPEAAAAVEELLGRLTAGHVLITSRLGGWSGQVAALDLDVLAEEDAADFLLERTGLKRRRAETDDGDAHALAAKLDGLALALEQAGAYIARKRIRLIDYAERFDSRKTDVLGWFDARTMGYPASVATTWQTSFDQLGEAARSLLGSLACLAPDPVPREVVSGAEDGETLDDVLVELADYSLVRFLDEPPATFSVHRLVQEILRSRLGADLRAHWDVAVRLVTEWAPAGGQDIASWAKWQVLAPHCEAIFCRAEAWGDPLPVPYLLNGFASFLKFRSGAYAPAELLFRRALATLERVLGPEHPDTLTGVNNLAGLLESKGDYEAAEPLFRRALEVRERVLGPEHPNTLGSVNNLAGLLASKGDYEAAELLYRRALETNERVLGPEHPNTLNSVNNLAHLLHSKGEYKAAEPLYRRALEARERVLGPEHPNTLSSVNNLAHLLHSKGEYKAAKPLFRRALATLERVLGPQHPDTLISVNNLAHLLHSKGEYKAAEPLYRRALETSERVLGPEHPVTLISVNNLAHLLHSKGEYKAAEPLYRRALETSERVLGPEHPNTLGSVNNLAGLLASKGDYEAAEPLYRRALATLERVLGPEHPDTLISVNNLAHLLHSKGEYKAAEPLYRRALEARERVLGPEHPNTLTSMNNLAYLLQSKGDYPAAEALYRQALQACEHVLGPEHPDTLASVNNLAGLLARKGDYEAAEPLYRRALRGAEKTLGADHPTTIICRRNWEHCRAKLDDRGDDSTG